MPFVKSERYHKLKDVLSESYQFLSRHGIDNPRLEADLMVSHLINVDRFQLLLNGEYIVGEEERDRIIACIKRRGDREPFQYITGGVEFYGHQFLVKKGVFIPRPETEFLAEEGVRAASILRTFGREDLNIVDLCAGSGCLAVTLAKEVTYSKIYATDISPLCMETLSENAGRLGASGRIEFFMGDLFVPLRKRLPAGSVDLIVSNPPYISSGDIASLPPEVKDYEPRSALDGGVDGLEIIKRIIDGSIEFLSDKGYLLLEIGAGQAELIKEFAGERSFFKSVEFRSDYAGIERVAILHG